ncbi:MAG TPA: GMC family oxidoreductase N-terminal domain-containing protein [Longimicrobiales bacterium]|nr:GMC family oxidoreductase N-terminal domain-containing protein [Longimicrobiales bacterium]
MIDHLIVGGGSAGCVLAARLSEDTSHRVLLLEAGPRDTAPEIEIPLGFHKLLGGELDWDYRTDPSDDPTGRARRWPQGRVLGGSSSINAMIWMRGHPTDYDAWARATGDDRWAWSNVRPILLGMEDHHAGASMHHGADGPMRIERLRDPHPLSAAFLDACADVGIPRTPDFNGGEQRGAGWYEVTQRRGTRWSAARGYLRSVLGRRNLEVRTGAFVRRVLVRAGRAVGIEVEVDGTVEEVLAGEVVLAAGAIGSPHLLLRSGIGPSADLEAAGVDVVQDLPGVGADLQDHPCVPVAWRTDVRTILDAETFGEYLKWRLLRRGMLTSNVAEAGAMLCTRPDDPVPDIQFHFIPAFAIDHGTRNPDGSGFTIGVTLVRVASRGRIRIASADPHAPPIIEAGTFSESEDLERMVEGVRIAREVGRAGGFDVWRIGEEIPGEGVGDADDDLLRRHCLAEHQTLYHPVGTVAMGSDESGAPLTPDLRVRGVPGLRVIDASVMPRIPNANTNAPTMLVAEVGARAIRAL